MPTRHTSIHVLTGQQYVVGSGQTIRVLNFLIIRTLQYQTGTNPIRLEARSFTQLLGVIARYLNEFCIGTLTLLKKDMHSYS